MGQRLDSRPSLTSPSSGGMKSKLGKLWKRGSLKGKGSAEGRSSAEGRGSSDAAAVPAAAPFSQMSAMPAMPQMPPSPRQAAPDADHRAADPQGGGHSLSDVCLVHSWAQQSAPVALVTPPYWSVSLSSAKAALHAGHSPEQVPIAAAPAWSVESDVLTQMAEQQVRAAAAPAQHSRAVPALAQC